MYENILYWMLDLLIQLLLRFNGWLGKNVMAGVSKYWLLECISHLASSGVVSRLLSTGCTCTANLLCSG